MISGTTILACWSGLQEEGTVRVSPDGCRDLILRMDLAKRPVWFISGLQEHTYDVAVASGASFHGFRLRPGTILDDERLLNSLRERDPEPDQALPLINEFSRLCPKVEEMLACLAEASSIDTAAKQLGVPPRQLQRFSMHHTQQSPGYWLRLARVRRAARAVLKPVDSGREPLAAVAADHHYADQAHMTRDFRRWLGTTPTALRTDPELAAQLMESGYG